MRSISKFFRDERGSQTIEFVLWIPMIGAMLVLVTDASFLYLNHTEMENVARDTARRMSAGFITSKTDAEVYAAAELNYNGYPYTVTADYKPTTAMSVIVSVPVASVTVFGHFLKGFLGDSMNVIVTMRSDPNLALLAGGGGGGGNGGGNGGKPPKK